jgi:1,4-dihydroxy-6-naphthoate synthase
MENQTGQSSGLHNEITIYHSPDADDAFMFYGLTSGAISYPGYTFRHNLSDIETLNQRARRGEIDCTAVSVHAFAYLAKDYVMLRSGASMGGADYGPRLVALSQLDLKSGKKLRIALPGAMTSATLAMRIYLTENGIDAELVQLGFDAVQHAVKNGEVDCGVIIHEGQITHGAMGLVCVLDLGAWWWEKTEGLPLPLGVNIVKRALGAQAIAATATVLKGTIEYSLANREKALEYALSYGRGLSRGDADKFVGWYVNERTVDIGVDGEKSVRMFLELGARYGLCPSTTDRELFVAK